MLEIVSEGGVFMWPLLLGSALALGLGAERAFYFWGLGSAKKSFRDQLAQALGKGDLDRAASLTKGAGPAQATAAAAVEYWGQDMAVVEAAMSAQAQEYEPALNRYLGVLETIVTAAPLIGLLGTITGMMSVFRTVALKLSNDPHANTTGVTAGIGEALVATATGILVAVLALLLHNLFQGLAESRMSEMEQVAETVRFVHAKKTAKAN